MTVPRLAHCGLNRRRATVIRLILLVVGLTGLGCQPKESVVSAPSEPASTPTDIPWEDQVAAVQQGTVDRIEVYSTPVSDQQLKALESLTGLQVLVIDQGEIHDAGVASLATLPELRQLRLRLSPLTNTGLQALLPCKNLQVLNLPHTRIDCLGLKSLAALPDLRQLRLGSSAFTASDPIGETLAEIRSLRSVHLIDLPFGDDDLEALGSLPHLQSLYLDGAQVSDAAWTRFFDLHRNIHVHIDQSHHDRDPHRHP